MSKSFQIKVNYFPHFYVSMEIPVSPFEEPRKFSIRYRKMIAKKVISLALFKI
jgi:hypothetical protein